jgi:hypothetical protein
MLNDQEIILRAKQTPQKLKDSYQKIIRKLDKYGIKLNSKGKIDFDKIKDDKVRIFVERQEKLITTCLLERDLNFEVPHHMNRASIRDNILKEIEEEEKRLAKLNQNQESEQNEKRLSDFRNKKLSYESYFQIDPNCISYFI